MRLFHSLGKVELKWHVRDCILYNRCRKSFSEQRILSEEKSLCTSLQNKSKYIYHSKRTRTRAVFIASIERGKGSFGGVLERQQTLIEIIRFNSGNNSKHHRYRWFHLVHYIISIHHALIGCAETQRTLHIRRRAKRINLAVEQSSNDHCLQKLLSRVSCSLTHPTIPIKPVSLSPGVVAMTTGYCSHIRVIILWG